MRDLLLAAIMVVLLFYVLRNARIGAYVWAWLSLANPHRQTFGFARQLPFSYVTAIVTLVSLLYSKDRRPFPVNGITVVQILFLFWMTVTSLFALGANDGLRGLPVAQIQDNLTAMIKLAKAAKARVLLVGMRMPPNYGPVYTHDFEQAFVVVAKQQKVALLPFLLAPIAGQREAFQADGLHPIAAMQGKILDHVYPALVPLLK